MAEILRRIIAVVADEHHVPDANHTRQLIHEGGIVIAQSGFDQHAFFEKILKSKDLIHRNNPVGIIVRVQKVDFSAPKRLREPGFLNNF